MNPILPVENLLAIIISQRFIFNPSLKTGGNAFIQIERSLYRYKGAYGRSLSWACIEMLALLVSNRLMMIDIRTAHDPRGFF